MPSASARRDSDGPARRAPDHGQCLVLRGTPLKWGAAQGFPADYNFQPECEYVTETGNRKTGILPKSHGIAKVGNSVSPPIAEALVTANCGM